MMETKQEGNMMGRDTEVCGDPKIWFPMRVTYQREMKIKKAGINPNLVDSEDHIESNMAKGWLTKEQADEARKIIADAKVEGEAQLKMPMIENIAKGRVNKFLKENCLVDQEFQFGDGDKATVAQWLAKQDKDLKIVAFKRFTLVAD